MTFRLYCPLRKIDEGAREVWGYASTEAEDSQGEIVRRDALAQALPDYMRYANIREMHRPSAVGVAEEAAVDDRGLWLRARIVDDEAWLKVREGVYKGFSIGGAVRTRDPDDRRIITGIELLEISLVDRPANPEAVFALWKNCESKENSTMGVLTPDAIRAARARLAQKWLASDGAAFDKAEDAARHEAALAKAATFAPAASPAAGLTHYDLEGAAPDGGDFADPGFQPDGRKRYPLDSEANIRAAWSYIHQARNAAPYTKDQLDHIKAKIIAAWRARIDRDGPPAARGKTAGRDLGKGLADAARLALIVDELGWLAERAAAEQGEENDASTVPADFQAAVARIAAVLRAMIDEETAELLDGGDDDEDFADALDRAAAPLPPANAGALARMLRGARLAKSGATVLARLPRAIDRLAKAARAGTDGAAVAKLVAANDALKAELAAALPLIREVKALVEKVAAQPAVPPPSRLVAIDKSDDVARELERIAAQPPAVTAFELIRRAMKEPLPFGAPLAK